MGDLTLEGVIPVFRVASVARAMNWYADVLGFSADPVGPAHDPVFAILRRDGLEIMCQKVVPGVGSPRSATQSGGGWDAYVRIYDADAMWEAVRAKVPDLGPIRTTEYGCREFIVRDPDGHVLVLGEC